MIEYKHKTTKKGKELYKTFKHYLWMKKIYFLIYKIDIINNIKYNLYCKRNYHKLTPCSRSQTNHKGDTLEINYLECKICKTKWFVSIEDKKIYQRLEESWNDMMSFHLKSIMEKNKNVKKQEN